MRPSRTAITLAVIVVTCAAGAHAQHPANRGGHAGGTHQGHPGHPASSPQHHLSADMQQQYLLQHGFSQTMMTNQMMDQMMMVAQEQARLAQRRTARQMSDGTQPSKLASARIAEPNAALSQRDRSASPGAPPSRSKSQASRTQTQAMGKATTSPAPIGHPASQPPKQNPTDAKSDEHGQQDLPGSKPRNENPGDQARPGEPSEHQPRRAVSDQVLVSMLKNARSKLKQAGQGPEGHCAKAIEHVEAALRQLGVSNSSLGDTVTRIRRLPAEGEDFLREATRQLTSAESALGTGTSLTKRQGRARASIVEAIRELKAP